MAYKVTKEREPEQTKPCPKKKMQQAPPTPWPRLPEQPQDVHVVDADAVGRLARLDNVGDERGPVLRPLLLDDLKRENSHF